MTQYAVINNVGLVLNVVQWDGSSGWTPPAGTSAVNTNGNSNAVIGATYSNGTFTPPTPTPPTALQEAMSLIASGVQLTSTGTPSLNGTYGCGPSATADINAVVTYILLNSTFPGGGTTMPWIDQAGTPHVFPDTTHFKNFSTAIANFVAQAMLYGNSGGTVGSLPSPAITIP